MEANARLLALFLFIGWSYVAQAQTGSTTGTGATELKRIVVSQKRASDPVIVAPPATSVRIEIAKAGTHSMSSDAGDLLNWVRKEAASNGLESTDLHPWHVVTAYDQFDEDGDNVHSGVYEEYGAGPKKYKRAYKSDNSISDPTQYCFEPGAPALERGWSESDWSLRLVFVDPPKRRSRQNH